MIVNFPEIQKNELLYSACSRYHQLSGNISLKDTMDDLFNNRNTSASVLLPSSIDNLAKNLPSNVYRSRELIEEHTLFRYYSAFFDEERTKDLLNKMKASDGKGVYGLAGVQASSIQTETYFKYCEECYEEMQQTGVVYWNRLFQLSEVKYCPHHGCRLKRSSSKKRNYNKNEFSSVFIDPLHDRYTITRDGNKDHLMWISEQIQDILSKNYKKRNLKWIKEKYMSLLQKLGYANVNKRINLKILVKEFFNFYDHDFLGILGVDFDEDGPTNWLSDTLRVNKRQASPLKHLLILRFLGVDYRCFISTDFEEFSPFGKGPWKCLNPICNHFNEEEIYSVELEYSVDTKSIRGLFKHSCGFEYYKYELTEKIRVVQYGELWEQELQRMIWQKKSLRSIANRLHVDPKTVVKHADRLGIDHGWNLKMYKCKENEDKGNFVPDQTEWLKLVESNPSLSVTLLRSLNPALYTRLYRNDKEWLKSNSPKIEEENSPSNRVDWRKRDNEFSKQCLRAINSIALSADYPVKVSLSRIGKEINNLSLLEKHIDQMPKTKDVIDKYIESEHQFRKRRIRWSIKKMIDDCDDLVAWRVFRVAGVREEYQEGLKDYVNELIDMIDCEF